MARGRGETGKAPMRARTGFATEVYEENDQVVIWLEDLGLYGTGDTKSEAEADLVAEVLQYMQEFKADEQMQTDPSRAHHQALLALCEKAQAKGRLADLIMSRLKIARP